MVIATTAFDLLVFALVDAARRWGFESVNVDLIYGLPLQTPASFDRTLAQIQRLLERHGLPIVIGWSFFPLLPTDAVCYVAGVVRMRIAKVLLGVAIGEGSMPVSISNNTAPTLYQSQAGETLPANASGAM